MAKKKNLYYVLVFTDAGPVYVTKMGAHHTCWWDRSEQPLALSRYVAEDIAWGLRLNGTSAIACFIGYEVSQPYLYKEGQFTWSWNEKEVENVNEE